MQEIRAERDPVARKQRATDLALLAYREILAVYRKAFGHLLADESLTLKIIAIAKQPIRSVSLCVRPLGRDARETLRAEPIAHAVFQATLLASLEDMEYHLVAKRIVTECSGPVNGYADPYCATISSEQSRGGAPLTGSNSIVIVPSAVMSCSSLVSARFGPPATATMSRREILF